jgi:site-specific recombinase XerD
MSAHVIMLFFLRKPKTYQDGPWPVYLRISVNGKRSETTVGREWLTKRWNARAGRAKGTADDVRRLNVYLDGLQQKVYEAHRLLEDAGELINAENIRDAYLGKYNTSHLLIETFKAHNDQMKALLGKEYSKGTMTCFRTSFRHTQDFIKLKYKRDDMEVKRVDYAFIRDFDFYLRSNCNCANNSAVKNIRNFGKIVRICMANGWLKADPFVHYKKRIKTVDRVYLATDELDEIAHKNLGTGRLSQVRDIFLFCCYTGLAYIDVQKLRSGDIVKGVDGEKWIDIKRQKTSTSARVPLLPAALNLIGQYADHPHCERTGKVFPVSSNQKMNAYLKEIADLCNINKPVTFHTARHTFATTVTLLNGVPIESVSKMLGHTNLRITQHYAKILDIKVGADMALLKQKYAAK